MKQPCVYMMASNYRGTIYIGVTSDLIKRVYEHKEGITKGFTTRYRCHRLVWFEQHETMESAITREKQLKGGSRQAKIDYIEPRNRDWDDLYPNPTPL